MHTANLLRIPVTIRTICGLLSAFILLSFAAHAQTSGEEPALLKRTKYLTETVEFGPGGTLTVIGSPVGSIEITGWNRNEIEISSEIEVRARTEEDLARLAEVTGFAAEESLTRLSVVSLGPDDRKNLKRLGKDLPKELRRMPYRIDYRIKVPHFTDLEVNGGRGDFTLALVEGMMRLNYLESNARLSLAGGAIQATIGRGEVDVEIPVRSWRGQFAEVLVTRGRMNLWLTPNLNANLTARILRTGRIENLYPALKPLRQTAFTEKEMRARAGSGGAELNFAVGDGDLRIDRLPAISGKPKPSGL